MGNSKSFLYVDGTSALELPRETAPGRPRLITVDFRHRSVRNAQIPNERTPVIQRPATARRNAVRAVERTDALGALRSDASVAVDALGLREIYEELEYGSAAGHATGRISFVKLFGCCCGLLAFLLLVITL